MPPRAALCQLAFTSLCQSNRPVGVEGWGCGGEWRREGTSCPSHSASLTFTIHVFNLKKDLISIRTPSHRAVRKWPKHCVFGLVTSRSPLLSPKKLKMLDLPAASSEPQSRSCSWVFTVHFAFSLYSLQSGCQQTTLKIITGI